MGSNYYVIMGDICVWLTYKLQVLNYAEKKLKLLQWNPCVIFLFVQLIYTKHCDFNFKCNLM
jgi:hypothetical protein